MLKLNFRRNIQSTPNRSLVKNTISIKSDNLQYQSWVEFIHFWLKNQHPPFSSTTFELPNSFILYQIISSILYRPHMYILGRIVKQLS